MKLSIAWIFDHINADYKKVNIQNLIKLFNETTAEIEGFEKLTIELDNLTLAKVTEVTDNFVNLHSSELKKDIELPFRQDAKLGDIFLIRKDKSDFYWAYGKEFGAHKDILLPALLCKEEELSGKWKKSFESEDYILDIDNKSITNRPDLWGHRGFAREFALILNLDLIPEDNFLEKIEIKKDSSKVSDKNLTVSIKDDSKSKKLSGLFVEKIDNVASPLWMAARLAKVDSRPINAVVDATNYTMLDIGQPMHAFDADEINNQIIARAAKNGEKLVVLDGDEVELTSNDCVIASEKVVTSLAGIMGGQKSGISSNTKKVVLESGNFDSSVIRATSTRLKKRSEASARFEKTLDPAQTEKSIERFVKLFKNENLEIDYSSSILSAGKNLQEKEIVLKHKFIENRLGLTIDSTLIEKNLSKIGFGVEKIQDGYRILVPSVRATKDITIEEDIVEEIARIFGYSKIPYQIPLKEAKPHNIEDVLRLRKIKNYMSFGCKMMEVRTYPFFDQSFIEKLNWAPKDNIEVLNPVSQNYKTLVSSLIPSMLKVVETNLHKVEQMMFYEWGRTWNKMGKEVSEKKVLSGIIFEHKKDLNFYDAKNYIEDLLCMLNIKAEWKKLNEAEVWYDQNISAQILFKDKVIGKAGFVDKKFLNKVSEEGTAFIFELDGDFLINFKSENIKFEHLVKYQPVELDVSALYPLKVTVEQVQEKILNSNLLIQEVYLVDSFEKPDWIDQKSLTFRFKLVDEHKTLQKEEIEAVLKQVEKNLESVGAQIR